MLNDRSEKCVHDTDNSLRRAIIILDFGEGSMGQLCNMLKINKLTKYK